MHTSKHFTMESEICPCFHDREFPGCWFYGWIRWNTLNNLFGVIHWSINSVNELLHSTFCLRTSPWKTSFSSCKMGILKLMFTDNETEAQAGPKADVAMQKSQFLHPTSKHSDAQVAFLVALSPLQHPQFPRSWGKTLLLISNIWGNFGAALAKWHTPPWVTA